MDRSSALVSGLRALILLSPPPPPPCPSTTPSSPPSDLVPAPPAPFVPALPPPLDFIILLPPICSSASSSFPSNRLHLVTSSASVSLLLNLPNSPSN
ncbi:unnamed protein product [Schistocephalus solidus]|uniref:Secreted protein n=1 Tax=Schistocephalus solidus TaxID=70667 RepID=A0A183SZW4_SCHSO|nr:unnamed protein product [Schistocephalus solidus]